MWLLYAVPKCCQNMQQNNHKSRNSFFTKKKKAQLTLEPHKCMCSVHSMYAHVCVFVWCAPLVGLCLLITSVIKYPVLIVVYMCWRRGACYELAQRGMAQCSVAWCICVCARVHVCACVRACVCTRVCVPANANCPTAGVTFLALSSGSQFLCVRIRRAVVSSLGPLARGRGGDGMKA